MCLQVLLKQLLAEPALQISSDQTAVRFAHAPQVRFLILKNLAANLAEQDWSCEEALQFYIEAAKLDATDTVLWHRMGALVSFRVSSLPDNCVWHADADAATSATCLLLHI